MISFTTLLDDKKGKVVIQKSTKNFVFLYRYSVIIYHLVEVINLQKNFAVDLAYVHAFEKKVESIGKNLIAGGENATVGAKNSQNEVGIALRWSF
jgi:hypothetical protein